MRRIGLVAVGLVVLSGCGAIQVKLGTRVSLAKVPVTSMVVSQYKHPGIGPGEKSSLVATLTEPNGTVLVSAGKGGGKVQWKDLAVTATVVSVNKSGVITLPRDPRLSDGKTGHIAITVPSSPGVSAALDIPLRYNYAFAASYSGTDGTDGTAGTDGLAGSDGSIGSFDPNSPSAGGDGGNGTNGSNGSDGGNGDDGPAVQVRATVQAGVVPLLQIGVTTAGHKERFYLVDPQGGSLTVTSAGGSGGKGGKGGSGGSAGMGGAGSPYGSDGSAGSDGSSGNDGSDGDGGSITLTYDSQVVPYLAAIKLVSPSGPKVGMKQGPVGPLW